VLGVFAKNRSGVKTNWTKKKVSFIQNNFREMTTKELCNHLKITNTVVRMKMKELGIRKDLKNEKCYA
jgi:predicted ArsR family transcriptional regulator